MISVPNAKLLVSTSGANHKVRAPRLNLRSVRSQILMGPLSVKRRHGLRRCRYRGLLGMVERWVGLGVIANDLLVLGRAGSRTG
jgi:hypothetical protein